MKFVVVLLAIICCAHAHPQRVVMGFRSDPPDGWDIESTSAPDHLFPFSIQLFQCNLDTLFHLVQEISNPDSPSYRKYITVDEMNQVTLCPDNVHGKAVANWLMENGVGTFVQQGNTIRAKATVKMTAELFDTEFYNYVHFESASVVIRSLGEFSIPSELEPHIEMVTGLSEFFYDTKYKAPMSYSPKHPHTHLDAPVPGPFFLNASDLYVTPALLSRIYNVSKIAPGTKNKQGIAAFDDYYDSTALCTFQNAIMQDFDFVPPLIYKGFDPIDELNTTADETESDLDIQYITAMGRGILTEFFSQDPGYWILDWAEAAVQDSDDGPYVWSISYGWPEVWQCASYPFNITTCPTGYSSATYVSRTNTEIAKFALLGVSVLVASGDDGAPGFSPNFPLDPNILQPSTGLSCNDTLPGVKSCGCATLVFELSNGSRCVYPTGLQITPECEFTVEDSGCSSAYDKIIQSQSCQINGSSLGADPSFFYSECNCSALPPVTVGDCTVRGFSASDATQYPIFYSDFPAASPYVTTVAATQLRVGLQNCQNDMINQPEHITSPFTYAFAAGGGFSYFSPQPWYQNVTVPKYLGTSGATPPSNYFNSSGRAYPDVSFNGHNFVTVLGLISAEDQFLFPTAEFGTIEEIQGTSASSPALAGLISLINSFLLANNKPTLGFLNPLLYKMAAEAPDTFNDIVSYTYPIKSPEAFIGNNACSRFGCSEYSFSTTPGWDATSGLGTPNFGNILAYIAKQNNIPLP